MELGGRDLQQMPDLVGKERRQILDVRRPLSAGRRKK
jgi:hypothetical protein